MSFFSPFLLLPDLSCHCFFSFSYMPGQSRVSTVLFALCLSLSFFPSISTTGWLNGGRSSHKGCPQLERQLGLSLNVKLQPSNIKHDGSAEEARRQEKGKRNNFDEYTSRKKPERKNHSTVSKRGRRKRQFGYRYAWGFYLFFFSIPFRYACGLWLWFLSYLIFHLHLFFNLKRCPLPLTLNPGSVLLWVFHIFHGFFKLFHNKFFLVE